MFANAGQTVQLCKQSELSGEDSGRVRMQPDHQGAASSSKPLLILWHPRLCSGGNQTVGSPQLSSAPQYRADMINTSHPHPKPARLTGATLGSEFSV